MWAPSSWCGKCLSTTAQTAQFLGREKGTRGLPIFPTERCRLRSPAWNGTWHVCRGPRARVGDRADLSVSSTDHFTFQGYASDIPDPRVAVTEDKIPLLIALGELTIHPGSTSSPETHVMQREGGTEYTFCQQLINPKQAFLLVAVWSLSQDLK